MLEEIAYYIRDNITFETGTELIVDHYAQDSSDRCVLIANYSGGDINFYVGGFKSLLVSFESRDTNWRTAKNNAERIVDHFCAKGARSHYDLPIVQSGSSYHVNTSIATGIPFNAGEDEKRRWRYTFDVRFQITIND